MSDQFAPYALVADDDALIRWDASSILEDAGFRIHEASNVDQAINILVRNPNSIHVLFTDVDMPPGTRTGFDLARECAVHWPKISILVASGMSEPKPGDLPGEAHFIRKPFCAHAIIAHLRAMVPDEWKPAKLLPAAR